MKRRAKDSAAGDSAALSIGALALATGIPVQTLRTWERRYGAPQPERKPSGHRVYSLESVEHLRKVARLLEAGHRAAEVVPLSSDRLESLLSISPAGAAPPSAARAPVALPPGASGPTMAEMLRAVRDFERELLLGMLRAQWSRLGPLRFLEQCAGALMAEVGRLWGEGELEIRHEHFATACLADLLREVREPFDRQARGPRVIAAVPSGDHHEGGLLMASVLLAVRGYRVVYLGLDTPVGELVATAKEAGVHAVVLSVSAAVQPARAKRAVSALRAALPRRVRLWVGGSGAPESAAGVTRFHSLGALDEALSTQG